MRVDSALYQGYKIPPTYDSMIAKLIVHGHTREEAIHRMCRALEEMIVQGVDTNIDLHYVILQSEAFAKGDFDTGFIEKYLKKLVK